MKRISSYTTIGLVIIILLWITAQTFLYVKTTDIKEKVGSKVILEQDTLMIIDYSLWKNTYTISNGKEISFELVKHLKTVK